jgi:serine protease Do
VNARTALLSGAAILAGALAPAQTTPAEGDLRPAVEAAIGRVYPALVRIHVVAVSYENGREIKSESSGSGVIIAPEGYVITNHHVAGKGLRIRCTLADRQELEARLVGTDPLTDIAVVQLDLARRESAVPLPVARFGDSDGLAVGDRVLAMGSPLALSQSVTLGIVSNLEMTMPELFWPATIELDGEETGSLVKWIGHDAQIFPGNSGGPLANLEGEIVGINEISLGLAGAIPGNLARDVARELIEQGAVRRSWLGLQLQPLLDGERVERGALVASVVPGSPAAAAGLEAGDLLVSWDGTPVHARYGEELPGINRLMLETPVGREVELGIRRGGEPRTIRATTVERGAAQGVESEISGLGITARELTLLSARELNRDPGSGVLVSSVRPGAAASEARPPLQPGDILVALGEAPVRRLAELVSLVESHADDPGDARILLGFERGSERLLSAVRLGRRDSRDRSAEAVKAWVPVATQVLTTELAEALGVASLGGVRVSEVHDGLQAPSPGVRVGDVFTRIDGVEIPATQLEDAEVFASLIRQYPIGAEVELEGLRDGEPLRVRVTLVESPRSERELAEYRDERFDFSARDLTFHDRRDPRLESGQSGALVTGVESGGWAALARLAVGDIVIAVDGRPVLSGDELRAEMRRVAEQRAPRVVFLVRRGVSTLFLELEPDWGTAALPPGR